MIKIISTPIGNFADITLNALESLKNADVILCEDTRKTDILLKFHNILGKKLLIHNEYTAEKDLDYFLELAKTQRICLVCDAGTPLICDPGHKIIAKARKKNVKIEICGGICSLIVGATLCGINIQNMLFLGFFSEKNAIKKLHEGLIYAYFVAPHDVLKFLKSLESLYFSASLKIAKDLTKEYEQCLEFINLENAVDYFKTNEPKGEFVFFVKFTANNNQNLAEILTPILGNLQGWERLGKKDLAKFLHEQCYELKNFTVKEIYNFLNQ